MVIDRMKIAQRIKGLRYQSRYSQQYIADKLFISQAAYSLLENGQNCIALDHIIRLSCIYHKTTDFLLLGKESEHLS
ncbi:helix-turn-helix domain-containing protein [Autumnicola edwardsiae]|uniref:Helix-turn-helix transcriptional regulator n=1 Tax=Autumnicola edwardsiae TaxID=3075594 RepID=A0ABU3CZ43_9FLAO|nr:helix-turn-helix transcriptional regulator [Zunongwangia sp. F297]MDT0651637.1 helix-turn-helix transcriptional regulator [Zunongwangia sp. F297]